MPTSSVLRPLLLQRRFLPRLVLGACLTSSLACAGLHPFRADLGRMDIEGQTVRPPYLSTISYYGHLSTRDVPESQGHLAPSHAIYLWLPRALPELGVRLLSPSLGLPAPRSKDYREPSWEAHAKARAYFDPALRIERCMVQQDPTDLSESCASWRELGANDDSPELRRDPSGHARNALVRLSSPVDDPARAIVRGLYRISLLDEKRLPAQGTFLLQLGAPLPLDEAVLARSLPQLSALLQKRAKDLPLVPQLAPAPEPEAAGAKEKPFVLPLRDSLAPPLEAGASDAEAPAGTPAL